MTDENDTVHTKQENAMIVQDAAKKLNGCEYGKEGSEELFAAMKTAGLVAVFGSSDDLIEFRGAIYDEVAAYDGGVAYLTSEVAAYDGGVAYLTRAGLLVNECDNEDCPHYLRAETKAAKINALWCAGDTASWTYETSIPHATFTIYEKDEPYCIGIVFALADVDCSSEEDAS